MSLQTQTFYSSWKAATSYPAAYRLYLVLTEESVDIATNTSEVSYRLGMERNSQNRFNDYQIGYSIKLNYEVIASRSKASSPYIGFDSDVYDITIASGTATVTHNADGLLSMPVEASIDMTKDTYGPGAMSLSGTMDMTLIPRASEPTVSCVDVELGTQVTIYTNRKSEEFTHKLYCVIPSQEDIYLGTCTDSIDWTPPIDLATYFPNTTSGACSIMCYTYDSADTLIGEGKSVDIVLQVPEYAVPTASLVVQLIDESGWKLDEWVKNNCRARLVTTASGSYGSEIVGYDFVDGLSGADVTTDVLTEAGDHYWTVNVTDTRGRTTEVSAAVYVQDYMWIAVIGNGTTFERYTSVINDGMRFVPYNPNFAEN